MVGVLPTLWPMQCMYVCQFGKREVVLMPKSLMARWVRIIVVPLRIMHISLVSLIRTLSNFRMSGLEKGPHSKHKLCLV